MLLLEIKAKRIKNRQIYIPSSSYTIFRYTWIALAYYAVLNDRRLTCRRSFSNGHPFRVLGLDRCRLPSGICAVFLEELYT